MSEELHYTSVPRGMKPGTRGFCTVARTVGLSAFLADRLEGLSGYRPVFTPHDKESSKNPTAFSHLRLGTGGASISALSRVAPAGLDYTDRANKYAQHIILGPSERPAGGPALLLSLPDFLDATWQGEPRLIDEGRRPPTGDRPPGCCRAWAAAMGDAGWAGVLAESFLADPRRLTCLVFEPGQDVLPLYVEAIALLPRDRRWDVGFSTYYNGLPQDLACPWRAVLAGSDEALRAARLPDALIFDLTRPSDPAEGGALVELARTGVARRERSPIDAPRLSSPVRTPTTFHGTAARPESSSGIYGMVPEPETSTDRRRTARPSGRSGSRKTRRGAWTLLMATAGLLLVAGLSIAIWWMARDRSAIKAEPSLKGALETSVVETTENSSDPKNQAKPDGHGQSSDTTKAENIGSQGTTSEAKKPPAETKTVPPPETAEAKKPPAETKIVPPPEPILTFQPLPAALVSGIGSSQGRTIFRFPKGIRSFDLIGYKDEVLKETKSYLKTKKLSDSSRLGIERDPAGGQGNSRLVDPTNVGEFSRQNENHEIMFSCEKDCPDEAIKGLAECVLKVTLEGGDVHNIFLRAPFEWNEPKPLSNLIESPGGTALVTLVKGTTIRGLELKDVRLIPLGGHGGKDDHLSLKFTYDDSKRELRLTDPAKIKASPTIQLKLKPGGRVELNFHHGSGKRMQELEDRLSKLTPQPLSQEELKALDPLKKRIPSSLELQKARELANTLKSPGPPDERASKIVKIANDLDALCKEIDEAKTLLKDYRLAFDLTQTIGGETFVVARVGEDVNVPEPKEGE